MFSVLAVLFHGIDVYLVMLTPKNIKSCCGVYTAKAVAKVCWEGKCLRLNGRQGTVIHNDKETGTVRTVRRTNSIIHGPSNFSVTGPSLKKLCLFIKRCWLI